MNNIRVLEVNKAYFPHIGGIETVVRQYTEGLGRLPGVSVKVLACRSGAGRTLRRRVNGIDVTFAGSIGTYLSCPVSLPFIGYFRKMAAKSDVVHIHFPFPLADIALLLSGFRGKVIVSWHSDIISQKRLMPLYRPFMRYLLDRADCILAATEGHISGSDVLGRYRHKCRILPYGIRAEQFSGSGDDFLTEKCSVKDSVKLLFTGRLVYYKGIDVLIRAAAKTDGCELFIAGDGILREELEDLAVRCGIGSRVHFLGTLTDDELRRAYADCDIFVLPSVKRSEAFGLVQLEAMASGKPVINTRLRSGVPCVSLHGKTGITVRPGDADMLAAAINRLASDSRLRQELGRRGRERVMEVFDEEKTIQKLRDMISEQ